MTTIRYRPAIRNVRLATAGGALAAGRRRPNSASVTRSRTRWPAVALAAVLWTSPVLAQQAGTAEIAGRVYAAVTGAPVPGAQITVEGTALRAVTDSAGHYRLAGVPAGMQTLVVRRIGFALVRVTLTVPAGGAVTRDVALAESALRLPEITVTAEPAARARGELGTASVIDRDAIANQTASSLAGVLELVPGVLLQPPGLASVQQFAIRSVPTSSSTSLTAGGPTAGDLASFGTLIVLDGVPLSNNANLQSLGPRGELQALIGSTAGGGIDLRQIPATTIERVEVIRGIPSTRYGDLTQGVVVVETRAGEVAPALRASFDPSTLEGSFVGGRALGRARAVTLDANVAHTQIAPGRLDDDAWRFTGQLAHHITVGGGDSAHGGIELDTRVRFFQVNQDNPEQPEIVPGQAASNHDRGLRLLQRARLGREGGSRLTLTTSLEHTRRQSTAQFYLLRGAMPFTDRLTEGRQDGHFVLGSYLARVRLDGSEWHVYSRLEAERPLGLLGFDHTLRTGLELRREWNPGAGYQFDVEFPPQTTFNGVQGFDRPRRFDAIPPIATTGLYVDDRLVRTIGGNVGLEVQAGLRADLLHRGTTWLSGVRDGVLQPRLNAQLAPWPWLRLRAGAGRTAKTPSLGSLYPSPQYFDVVNVNYFANDSAERLAVLTTFIRDPTKADLGFSVGRKAEAGIEIASARGNAALSLVAFRDGTTGGVGFLEAPTFVLRERFTLDSMPPGQPPRVVEPAAGVDTMPVLIDRPANILTLQSTGYEGTLVLPEIRPLRLTIAVQGAWTKTSFFQDGPDFGRRFADFQLDPATPRSPYWESVTRKGTRALVTYRLIHHQPQLGLVVTAVIEHIMKEEREDVAATDTLAFAGYVTRTGQLVAVPPEQRADSQYMDLWTPRAGSFLVPTETPADWLLSVQVSKTLPLGGELRFSAFNILDRLGRIVPRGQRTFPRLRFGIEVTMPLAGLLPARSEGP